jgi:hypothetical protein
MKKINLLSLATLLILVVTITLASQITNPKATKPTANNPILRLLNAEHTGIGHAIGSTYVIDNIQSSFQYTTGGKSYTMSNYRIVTNGKDIYYFVSEAKDASGNKILLGIPVVIDVHDGGQPKYNPAGGTTTHTSIGVSSTCCDFLYNEDCSIKGCKSCQGTDTHCDHTITTNPTGNITLKNLVVNATAYPNDNNW